MTTYKKVHNDLSEKRGLAASHLCVCGKIARFWAYQYSDSSPSIDQAGRLFSENPDCYAPMCAGCHRRLDLSADPRVRESARKEGKRMGDAHTLRMLSDTEFAARRKAENSKTMLRINTSPEYAEVMRAAREKARIGAAAAAVLTNRRRRQCTICGLTTTPAALGSHFRFSGHSGYVEIASTMKSSPVDTT